MADDSPGRDGLGEAWSSYRGLAAEFAPHEEQLWANRTLLLEAPDPPPTDLADQLAERSEAVEEALVGALEGAGDNADLAESLRDAAVALAAVDVHLAGDLLRLSISRDLWEKLARESEIEYEELLALVSAADEELRADSTSLNDLLSEVDRVVHGAGPAIAGAQDPPPGTPLEVEALDTIQGLIDTAREPVLRFAAALPLSATQFVVHVPTIAQLVASIGDELGLGVRAALRLVGTGLRKLSASIGVDSEYLIDAVRDVFGEEAADVIEDLRGNVTGKVIGVLVRRARCEGDVRDIATRAGPAVTANPPGALFLDMVTLKGRFDTKQRRAKKVGVAVKALAPVLVVVSPPVGPAAVAALVLSGCSYTLFGLADRLDTLPSMLSRTAGVPTILRSHVLPPPAG